MIHKPSTVADERGSLRLCRNLQMMSSSSSRSIRVGVLNQSVMKIIQLLKIYVFRPKAYVN